MGAVIGVSVGIGAGELVGAGGWADVGSRVVDEVSDSVGEGIGVFGLGLVVGAGEIVGTRLAVGVGAAVFKREGESCGVGVGTWVGSGKGALVRLGAGTEVWVETGPRG